MVCCSHFFKKVPYYLGIDIERMDIKRYERVMNCYTKSPQILPES
jgi:hypothetical protein